MILNPNSRRLPKVSPLKRKKKRKRLVPEIIEKWAMIIIKIKIKINGTKQ